MKNTTKILALPEGLQSFFPKKPDHWEFLSAGEAQEEIAGEVAEDVEILLSASIGKLDKESLDRFPNLRMIA